jgi:hypothetical protein
LDLTRLPTFGATHPDKQEEGGSASDQMSDYKDDFEQESHKSETYGDTLEKLPAQRTRHNTVQHRPTMQSTDDDLLLQEARRAH